MIHSHIDSSADVSSFVFFIHNDRLGMVDGHGACPTGERCLPILGTLLAPVGQNCSQTSVKLVKVLIPIFLFLWFCQRRQFLSSEFLTPDKSFRQPTIQTIAWQSDNSQLSACQSVTAKNQMVWQFLGNSCFLLRISYMVCFYSYRHPLLLI